MLKDIPNKTFYQKRRTKASIFYNVGMDVGMKCQHRWRYRRI